MPPEKPAQPSFSPREIVCPACGAACWYAQHNPWRPFCSARCKGVDFGAWASEHFRIPDDEVAVPSVAHAKTAQSQP